MGKDKATTGVLTDGRQVDYTTPEGLEILRHSTSHLLAQAASELFPGIQITIGPAIDTGFYYDFGYERQFTPEDLEKMEQRMREIITRNDPIQRRELSREDAIRLFEGLKQHFKVEIIRGIPEGEIISAYSQGEFIDLCTGPHVKSTGELRALKLLKLAGAYWRGDEKNPMLQRVYGTAFATEKELKDWLQRLEEAEKRDHRKLGKELDLFSIQPDGAGPGLIFWHPNGAMIRKLLEDYLKDLCQQSGYDFVYSPHVGHLNLWNTSGHTNFYAENMFRPMEVEDEQYQLKPMNCPFHVLIFRSQPKSFRDLPVRYAELGTVYRYERSGVLHGLMRVRGFTQDDAHIFCREDQIAGEVNAILDLMTQVLSTFGFNDFEVNLSTRPEKYVGELAVWNKAEAALREVLEKRGLRYLVDEGGGAFYGPKIDIKIRDSIGRQWQCSTVQVDFNLPERFQLEYTDSGGAKVRPIMIHRAIYGSIERFFGILVEHYAGAFPFWLAPVQVLVATITDAQADYAQTVLKKLKEAGIRAEADLRNEKLGFKVREAQVRKIPFVLVTGDKEMAEGKVAPRGRGKIQLDTQSVDEFILFCRAEAAARR
ncbi:MAG: threonine--tRNA ligase [Deltaproteobacteria bacterium]|nr:threonine--tRNA ligase [Deltaproteobacteria bacterium]